MGKENNAFQVSAEQTEISGRDVKRDTKTYQTRLLDGKSNRVHCTVKEEHSLCCQSTWVHIPALLH